MNISEVAQHTNRKGVLRTPMNTLTDKGVPVSFSSWRDSGINEMLWTILLRGNLEQEECLSVFRGFAETARENLENPDATFICHTGLAKISEGEFDNLFAKILSNKKYKSILAPLTLFDSLPDSRHWSRHLSKPASEEDNKPIFQAIGKCLDHQSQESTDVRWFKVYYAMFVSGKIKIGFADENDDCINSIYNYPNFGDQREVRPKIRAMEESFRGLLENDKDFDGSPQKQESQQTLTWHNKFWKEAFERTPCIPAIRLRDMSENVVEHYRSELKTVYGAVYRYFFECIEVTDNDPRLDGSFGIILYAIVIALGSLESGLHARAEGRLTLRIMVELYITLKYLSKKDEVNLWMQFRNYGSGQAKLAMLKNINQDELPEYLNIEDLFQYANEDFWQEYIDMPLGNWAGQNLRSMAVDAGVKEVYDRYYDWSSAFVHGNWSAIRDTNFTVCLNPLHRLHRIPSAPNLNMPSVLRDSAKLLNQILDVLSSLYPPFKARIKHPKEI